MKITRRVHIEQELFLGPVDTLQSRIAMVANKLLEHMWGATSAYKQLTASDCSIVSVAYNRSSLQIEFQDNETSEETFAREHREKVEADKLLRKQSKERTQLAALLEKYGDIRNER